ncbi:MAG: hypothetical protein GY808_11625, partial [Gammaproteobacteria bacterium]|nr:hypothetical protein [Gammaproteobacteria bacterium]
MDKHLNNPTIRSARRPGRLARRLAFYIIITSTIITFITTASQLVFDYWKDIESVDIIFEGVEQSHTPAIIDSLWNLDFNLSQVQIDGIANIPQIEYVEL